MLLYVMGHRYPLRLRLVKLVVNLPDSETSYSSLFCSETLTYVDIATLLTLWGSHKLCVIYNFYSVRCVHSRTGYAWLPKIFPVKIGYSFLFLQWELPLNHYGSLSIIYSASSKEKQCKAQLGFVHVMQLL